jgi:hypothetical protein
MNELFPIILGSLAGLCGAAIRDRRRRMLLIVVLSVISGAAATLASGEFKLAWGYLIIDVALAAFAAMVSMKLLKVLRRSQTVPRASAVAALAPTTRQSEEQG